MLRQPAGGNPTAPGNVADFLSTPENRLIHLSASLLIELSPNVKCWRAEIPIWMGAGDNLRLRPRSGWLHGRLPEREHREALEWLDSVDAFLRSTLASCSWLGGVEGFLPRTDELRLRFNIFSSIQDLQAVIIRYFLSAQITCKSPLLEQPTHTGASDAGRCRGHAVPNSSR